MNIKYPLGEEKDIDSLKTLWKLAFHDEEPYIQHFFEKFSPHQMFLAVKEDEILGMTYYFPSIFHRHGKSYKFAYLYGVATHPKAEKQGIASGLLGHIYKTLEKEGFDGVTTVPATPSLHQFFGRNGFHDYFVYEKRQGISFSPMGEKISGEEFASLREDSLKKQNMPYITLEKEGFSYQEGVCALGKGGFFRSGEEIYCVEQANETSVVVKEAFGVNPPDLGLEVLESRRIPSVSPEKGENFGMIQWFSSLPTDWHEEERGYLGLAFD